MATTHRSRARRGVVLLVILALMAMFGVVAITFVLITSQQRRSSIAGQRAAEDTRRPEKELNEAAMQVLRGSKGSASPLRPHSLLEDLYGADAVAGNLTGSPIPIAPVAGEGQLNEIPGVPNAARRVGCVITFTTGPSAGRSARIVGYSATTGNAQILVDGWRLLGADGAPGVRNVDDDGNGSTDDTSEIGAYGSDDAFWKPDSSRVPPYPGDAFVVNDVPYNGTGFGFRSGSLLLDAKDPVYTDWEVALLPKNVANLDRSKGAADEDYDAPDYQNVLLALLDPGNGSVPIPSLHQVPLINYWYNRLLSLPDMESLTTEQKWRAILQPWGPDALRGTADDNASAAVGEAVCQLKRHILFRPLREDHPNFTGSNPASVLLPAPANLPTGFWERNGPWDVDNNGDGVPDGVWVDLGLPVRSTPDGRRYKPLFSILCVDLDGRLNLNAHGCVEQTDYYAKDRDGDGLKDPSYYPEDRNANGTIDESEDEPPLNGVLDSGEDKNDNGVLDLAEVDTNGNMIADGSVDATLDGVIASTDLRYGGSPAIAGSDVAGLRQIVIQRGLGFGPADINLLPVFQHTEHTDPVQWYETQYRRLLCGMHTADGVLDGRYGESNLLLSTPPVYPRAGITNSSDNLFSNKFFDYPQDFANFSVLTAYGTPSDMRGLLAFGLDLRGQPLYGMLSAHWNNMGQDNPYKINLCSPEGRLRPSPASPDNPFSVFEMERLLRPFDRDSAQLPTRLLQLTSLGEGNAVLLNRRHEVTTESWDIPCPSLTGSNGLHGTGGNPLNRITDLATTTDSAELRRLFPPEVRAGLRMNLNRRFGNGIDDNGDNVVDDPDEALTGAGSAETFTYKTRNGTVVTAFDQDNDGTAGATTDPRQLYARHLYVLVMALADLTCVDNLTGSHDRTAALFAQWAVNVADFRDRDSIMTAFEYDKYPLDGWSVDGDLATDEGETTRGVVWGCERPELLITEALAFHDRRTEDTSQFGYAVPPNATDDKEEEDTDLDQVYRPEGSLFVELFNPWTANEPRPAEFYDAATGGVDLQRVTPDRNTVQSPVWRLKISEPTPAPEDEVDPDDAVAERVVYFCDSATMAGNPKIALPADGQVKYQPSEAANVGGDLLPGRYAVIGPGIHKDFIPNWPARGTTYIGLKSGATQGDATTRQIVLDPTAAKQVEVKNEASPASTPGRSPIAIVIDQPRDPGNASHPMRLSVSEPTGGYASHLVPVVPGTTYNPSDGKYNTAQDKPLDSHRTDEWKNALGKDGTTPRYRIIHLQRLANPLKPYDAVQNPYRTIDSMAVDLTCFNGVTSSSTHPDWAVVSPPAAPTVLAATNVMFHARQRGERNASPDPSVAPGTIGDVNLWKQEPMTKELVADNVAGASGHYFTNRLKHSLGYINHEYFPPRSTPADYVGDPTRPFPWLTWFNRPFVSQYELFVVPQLSAAKLLSYDFVPRANATEKDHYYQSYRIRRKDEPDDADPTKTLWFKPYDPATAQEAPFPHLPNFFHSAEPDVTGGTLNHVSPQLHRLLEFVNVPSPFVRTEVLRSPDPASDTGWHEFHAPYLEFPSYREPGRINLNTVFSMDVLRGLLNRPDLKPDRQDPKLWLKFMQSRRGYGTLNSAFTQLDVKYPTLFVNPFRSFAGVSRVPLKTMVDDAIDSEINATILRRNFLAADGSKRTASDLARNYALFQSIIDDADQHDYDNTNRNPFFRYRDIMRLGNLITTRSNVYAVWITVGYFEVEQLASGYDVNVYPDGYALGAELGNDRGEVERHRAFYLIDRTIPVGFQRGEDLNAGNCVLLKRFIE